eukprot:7529178-Pyramimonas_sp.AAC.1
MGIRPPGRPTRTLRRVEAYFTRQSSRGFKDWLRHSLTQGSEAIHFHTKTWGVEAPSLSLERDPNGR